MTPTVTPRLGLTVDALNETQIGVQKANWDRVDYAQGFARAPVGVSDKYDGQLSVDPSTGIAVETVGSTVQDITYPYLYAAYSTTFNAPSAPQAQWGWDVLTVFGCPLINSSGVDTDGVHGNGWRAPVKGIYEVVNMAEWAPASIGIRVLGIAINGTMFSPFDVVDNVAIPTGKTTNMQVLTLKMNKADWLNPTLSHTATGALQCTLSVRIRLVKALA